MNYKVFGTEYSETYVENDEKLIAVFSRKKPGDSDPFWHWKVFEVNVSIQSINLSSDDVLWL